MTKEQVMQTLIEAGFSGSVAKMWIGHFERFATLVRNAYRAELLAGVGEPAVKLHGKHKNGKLSAERMELYTAEQLAAAVLASRNAALEDAAQKCENHTRTPETNGLELVLAADAIRNLKETT